MGVLAGVSIGDILSNTIFGGSSFNDPKRVPMLFTSTYRLRQLDPNFGGISSASSIESLFGTIGQPLGLTVGKFNKKIVQASSLGVLPTIEMAVNPNSISWKQPKRITKRDTQEGSIFFHFANKKGQNNDILTLDFRGNTGNINLASTTTKDGTNTNTYKKALIWHNLWNLTRERMLLDDNTINEFMVLYSSTIISTEIMLIGFFSNVLDWTDSADKPFSKDYSMSFTVQQTEPPLDDIVSELGGLSFNPDEHPQAQ